ncbi:MAG: ATP-grasp domain-containing protein [Anaerolineae bacterium]
MRIAVIYGGNKTEPNAVLNQGINSRPYKSYEVVARDIQTALFEIGFEQLFLIPDDMHLPTRLKELAIDFAWINSCGVQGYNPASHTPAMLEMLGIPYVGHNPLNATLLDNKHIFKNELIAKNLRTAPYMTWNTTPGMLGLNIERLKHSFSDYSGPFVVKPVSGRASLHVHVVDDVRGLKDAINEIYQHNLHDVLVEKYLPGREFAVSVCGNVRHQKGEFIKQARPFAFSTIERVLADDERIFTSMDKRKITNDRVRMVEDPCLSTQLKEIAQVVFNTFSLRTLIRLDIRDDGEGNLYILEANLKPDLKRPNKEVTSLTAFGLDEAGLSYHDLILSLLADRLDYLLSQHSSRWPHLTALLETNNQFLQYFDLENVPISNEFEIQDQPLTLSPVATPSIS